MHKKISKFFLIGLIALGIRPLGAQEISSPHKGTQVKTIIVDPGHGLPDMGNVGKNNSYESDIALGIATKLEQKIKDSMSDVRVLMTRKDRNLPNFLTNKDVANRWRANFANENHGDLFISIHVNDDGRNGKDWHSEVVGHETRVYYTGKGRRKRKHTVKEPIYNRYSTPTGVIGTETYIWSVSKNDSKTSVIQGSESGEFAETDSTSDSLSVNYDTPEARIAAANRMRKYFERSLLLGTFIQNNFAEQGRVDRGVRQRPKGIWVLQATAMPSVLVETGFSCNEEEENYLTSDAGQNEIASAIFKAINQYRIVLAQRSTGNTLPLHTDSDTGKSN